MKVLDFYATWCSQCKTMKANLEKLSQEGTNVEFVDVDEEEELTDKYKVHSLPTIVLVDENNNEVKRHTGAKTINEIKQWMNLK